MSLLCVALLLFNRGVVVFTLLANLVCTVSSFVCFVRMMSLLHARMQDLSMASGLGQKYGAPRRNAQEKLRTEVSRSDTWGMEIQRSLELLRDLCRHKRGQVPSPSSLPAGPVLKKQIEELKGGPKKAVEPSDDDDQEEPTMTKVCTWVWCRFIHACIVWCTFIR